MLALSSAAEPHRQALALSGKALPVDDPLHVLKTLLEQAVHSRGRLEDELERLRQQLALTRRSLHDARARARHAQHDAHHDALTGLPNRSAFEQTTRRFLTGRAPGRDTGPDANVPAFGLLFIDLDGFKTVNDRHGHATGDALLQVIGRRLAHAVRADDAVCRHGGDEFVCLVHDVQGDAQVSAIARKLIDAVSAPCRIGATTLRVSPSVGIALYPQDGLSFETLLHSADAAMYHAKRQRLGHAFHSMMPGMAALPLIAPPQRRGAASPP
ncbi:GGDEF domain-containing protein [Ideonella sp. A 288]|uniref:GGDEF domain-containing protein n=1 Tax=Ideonella sp. A 288 TaxID=1962181 RepID=UPI000B4B02A9|nr:GGDEF domain-containing protein [Ideonella sp. A 288]